MGKKNNDCNKKEGVFLNYSAIKNYDIANGEGVGVSLFVSGCSFHCKGCFNQKTWNFNAGLPYTKETEKEIINLLSDKNIDHFSILGGEPLHPKNVDTVCNLIDIVHKAYPHLKIWIWTGYNDFDETYSDKTKEQVLKIKKSFQNVDFITFGRFILEKKNIRRVYSGSDNQYTINLKTSKIKENRGDIP